MAELVKSPDDIALTTDITSLKKNNAENKISAFIDAVIAGVHRPRS
jgi:hypothetical protein